MEITHPRVAVDAGEAPNPATQLVSWDSLYDYVRRFAEGELFTEIDLEDLLKETVPEDGRSESGRVIKAFASYELRYKAMRFSHSGIVGKCTPRDLAMSVRANYDAALTRLQLEQPSAQWQLVACVVRRDQVNRQFDKTPNVERMPFYDINQLVRSALHNEAEEAALRVGKSDARQGLASSDLISQTSVAADFRALMCCVWTDITQASLVDPWGHRFPGEHGPMQRYAETGELRYLTPNLKRERLQAKMLIQRLIELGTRIDEDEVDAEITEAQARMMLILRNGGQKWGEIAKAFSVPTWQRVKAAVLALDADCDDSDDEDG